VADGRLRERLARDGRRLAAGYKEVPARPPYPLEELAGGLVGRSGLPGRLGADRSRGGRAARGWRQLLVVGVPGGGCRVQAPDGVDRAVQPIPLRVVARREQLWGPDAPGVGGGVIHLHLRADRVETPS